MNKTIEQRFWAKTSKQSNGCWQWTGATDTKGYGRFHVWRMGTILAHRYAWQLTNGLIPEGMFACHRCDNPACVNPEHIFIGTAEENTRDMLTKQRHSRGESHGDKIRRADRGNRKLSPDDVVAIRAELKRGERQRDIARAFGISQGAVSQINRGATWGHVNG